MKRLLVQLKLINRGSRSVLLWAHAGLIAACTAVFFLFVLGLAAIEAVDTHLLGSMPEQELRVGLKKRDITILRMAEKGAKTAIAAEDLIAMAALQGVTHTYPLHYADQSSDISVNFMGQGFSSEMVIQAFEPDWVAGDVAPELLDWAEGQPVPMVINTQILAIYNNAYAKSKGMPQLSPKALEMPVMRIYYGKNPKKAEDPARLILSAKVVGLSPRVALGVAIPRSVLESLHKQLGRPMPKPLEVILLLEPDADSDRVMALVREMGYTIHEAHPLARIFRQAKVASVLAGLVLIVCVLLFKLSFLNQTVKMLFLLKRRDYAICRAMGMSRGRLRALLVFELLLLFGTDLIVGLFMGFGLAFWLSAAWISPLLVSLLGFPLAVAFPAQTLVLAALILAAALLFLAPRIWSVTREATGTLLGTT